MLRGRLKSKTIWAKGVLACGFDQSLVASKYTIIVPTMDDVLIKVRFHITV